MTELLVYAIWVAFALALLVWAGLICTRKQRRTLEEKLKKARAEWVATRPYARPRDPHPHYPPDVVPPKLRAGHVPPRPLPPRPVGAHPVLGAKYEPTKPKEPEDTDISMYGIAAAASIFAASSYTTDANASSNDSSSYSGGGGDSGGAGASSSFDSPTSD